MTDVHPTLHAARLYLERGWSPIPLAAGTKWPPPGGVTGWRGRYTTTADLQRNDFDWTGNIALRLPPDVVGIDIDIYNGGDQGLAELVDKHGPLPETVYSTSRVDGSGIPLFRVPNGTVLATDPAVGIDLVQYFHRYVVCAPSIHPEGRPYVWIDDRDEQEVDGPPEPGDLPELPWTWIEGLASAKTAGASAATPQAAAEFCNTNTARSAPAGLRGILKRLDGVTVGGRHDALVTTACWAMREAAAGRFTADEAVEALHGWWIDVMAGDPRRRESGEFGGAILWAIAQANGEPERVQAIRDRNGHTEAFAKPVEPRNANGVVPAHVDPETGEIVGWKNLPAAFWDARPYLEHIHDAAHARARSADAVLLFTLARVCATIPSSIRLPPIVGGPASLNFLGAVIGTSGSGKSSAGAIARELVPIDRRDVVADLPLGSGEGLVEQYFEYVPEEQANGKDKLVKRKTRDGLYMYLDEGQALAEMGNRKGATLLPTLRAAWSGETIGNANASVDTHRVVKAHTYRLALMVGFQAEHAHGLLDDAAGGTPQRFVFASAVDPAIPDDPPEWPGELDVWLPSVSGTMHIGVAAAIADEIRARNRAATRGQIEIAGLDSHRDLVRLKVAALLGFLDGRLEVDGDDWALAGLVMRSSSAVRTWVTEIARSAADAAAMAGHKRAAERELVIADSKEQRVLLSAAKSVARRAIRLGRPATTRELRAAPDSSHIKLLGGFDRILSEAIRLKWIEPAGDVLSNCSKSDYWTAGKARPA